MTRRIPIVETLDLVLNIAPDTVEAMRLEAADRDELLQHTYNLAYIILRQLYPGRDIERIVAINAARYVHVPHEHTPGD